LLGTSALTLVTLSSAAAAPVIESGDFGDTFATRTILASQGPVYGTLGGTDLFDYFQLSGFGASQSVRIVLTQIAQLPDASASASASSSTEASASGSSEPTGSTEASASGSSEPTGSTEASASGSSEPSGSTEASASGSSEPTGSTEASASGSSEPTGSTEASASGSSEPTGSTEASASGSSEPTGSTEASASGSSEPTGSAEASGGPTDVGFTLHLLDETGAFDPLAGDSGPDTSASAGSFPDGQVFGDRSFTFDLDTSTLPTGDLNLRLAYDGAADTFYQVTVTANTASAVSEPSGLLPFAAGSAGLGFLAARRRRRKK